MKTYPDHFVPTEIVWGEPERITCRRCTRTSFHHKDVAERYCGFCHVYHSQRGIHEAFGAGSWRPFPGLHDHANPSFRIPLGLSPRIFTPPPRGGRIACWLGVHDPIRIEVIVPMPHALYTIGRTEWVAAPYFWAEHGFDLYQFQRDAPLLWALVVYSDCRSCGRISPWPVRHESPRPRIELEPS